MAITCPRCGAEFDATLFEFEHQILCQCGAEISYPGPDLSSGHVASDRAGSGKCAEGDKQKGDGLTETMPGIDGPS